MRRASNSEGAGRRNKSVRNAAKTSVSQRNMAAMNWGDHQAGTTQTRQSRRATKKRVPKANGSRRRDWARAWTTGGTSELVTIASLGDFDSRKQLLDDLIGCEAFEVGFGLKQEARPEDRKSCSLHIIGEKIR